MAQGRVDRARARWEPKLKELRIAFAAIPDILPYFHEEDSPLAQAGDRYDALVGTKEPVRVDQWLTSAFGSLEHIVIPERGQRLAEVMDQLAVAVDSIAEAPDSAPQHFDIVGGWMEALLSAATSLTLAHVKNPPKGSMPARAPKPSHPARIDAIHGPQNAAQTISSVPPSQPNPTDMRHATQKRLDDFPRMTLEEQLARDAAAKPDREAARAARKAADEERAAMKKERERDRARDRQRAHRERVKEAKTAAAAAAAQVTAQEAFSNVCACPLHVSVQR